jgi:hypothetical protein
LASITETASVASSTFARSVVEVEPPVLADARDLDGMAFVAQRLRGVEHGVVLDRGRHQLAARAARLRERAAQRHVVRLAAAAVKTISGGVAPSSAAT